MTNTALTKQPEANDGNPPCEVTLTAELGRLRDRLLAYSDIRQRDPRESRDALRDLLTDDLLRLSRECAAAEQAMSVLRQIASLKRRTREQRLASSCVTFLDALAERLTQI